MSEESIEKVVPQSQFISLLNLKSSTRKKVQEANGALGGKLKSAADDANLNLFAFGVTARLDNMEELKRNSALRHLEIYIDWCKQMRWNKDGHTGDIVDMAKEDAAKAEKAKADAAHVAKNVKALQGIKPLAEKEKIEAQKTEDAKEFDVKSPSDLSEGGTVTPLTIGAGKKPKGLPSRSAH